MASTPISAIAPAAGPHLGTHHVSKRAAIAPNREEQDGHVLNRACKDDADQDPERAWQVSHLRGKHWAYERASPGDSREVVSEQHVFIGGNVIEAVIVPVCGGRLGWIDAQDAVCDEKRIKAEGEEIDTNRCNDEPGRADCFAPAQGDDAQGHRAKNGYQRPQQFPPDNIRCPDYRIHTCPPKTSVFCFL